MQESLSGGIAERYATALFELALEADPAGAALDTVMADLNSIEGALSASVELKRLIRSPIVSREEAGRALAAVLKALRAGDLTQRFTGLLASNRRLFVLPRIITTFRKKLADHRGETTAEVTSARALSPAQTQALKAQLKSALGKDVQVVEHVDASLLGGLVVKVGSRMIDSSLRTKLDSLHVAMKEA